MENGGNQEHRPWMFDNPGESTIVDTYRKFTAAHYQLVPYLMTVGAQAYERNGSTMVPLAKRPLRFPRADAADLANWPETYDYYLGPDIFFSPMRTNESTQTVQLPPSEKGWVSFWDPTKIYQGGVRVEFPCPLTWAAAFIRGHAILPLYVDNDLVGHGDRFSADALTLLINRPLLGQTVSQEVRESQGPGLLVSYTATPIGSSEHGQQQEVLLELSASGRSRCHTQRTQARNRARAASSPFLVEEYNPRPLLFVLDHVELADVNAGPASIKVEQVLASGNSDEFAVESLPVAASTEQLSAVGFGVFFDEEAQRLFVRPRDSFQGVRVVVRGILA